MDALRDRLIQAIGAGPPARIVVLFGSAATGKMRPDSDVDIAWLPVDGDLLLARELEFQVALTLAAGREVDLVRLDHASTLCRSEVARSGDLLSGDRPSFVKFRAEAIGEFLDFEPALREASARFRRRVVAGDRGDRT